jgi:pimeloyl-ACP methyl ester carboxylesterase
MIKITVTAASTALLLFMGAAFAGPSTSATKTYHTAAVDGVKIFYREAGPSDAPTLLLLHGFPSSSRQFDTLIPLLADRYHLVAPDYPGFGQSEAPPPSDFSYTFDHVAQLVDKLTDQLGLHNYVLYLNDYGGPIGFRLAVMHPERVKAMIIQNAVTSDEGLGPAWDVRRAYWKDRTAYEDKIGPGLMSFEGARVRHVGSSPHAERYNPDAWADEYAILARPGERQIQADLFYDYTPTP